MGNDAKKSLYDGDSLILKENNRRDRYLTEEEAKALPAECPVYLRHIVLFTLHTGARRKEVLGLKWTDIQGDYVNFRDTKTGVSRQVPMDDEVMGLLESLKSDIASDNVVSLTGTKTKPKRKSAYVFKYQGKKVADVKNGFKAACAAASIPYGWNVDGGVTFHTLRHIFGSWLAIKGVPIKTLQELMGHEDITMKMRYAHLGEDTKKEAVKLLSGRTAHGTVTKVSLSGEKAKARFS
jgi:integrase